jgi:TetR/AcrR family transcriptional repressor of nem operon
MPPTDTRDRLISTAISLIRLRGYEATSVDALCVASGVTKGAFFHHFRSKQDLALAAAAAFDEGAERLFRAAPFNALEDPVDRLLGYLALRREMIAGPFEAFTCLLGTLTQEVHAAHPAIRDAARDGMRRHFDMLARDIAAAEAATGRPTLRGAMAFARHMQAVLQGAFILAKAEQEPQIVRDCLDQLAHDVATHFGRAAPELLAPPPEEHGR